VRSIYSTMEISINNVWFPKCVALYSSIMALDRNFCRAVTRNTIFEILGLRIKFFHDWETNSPDRSMADEVCCRFVPGFKDFAGIVKNIGSDQSDDAQPYRDKRKLVFVEFIRFLKQLLPETIFQ
jgi:hypothetical protein